MEDNLLKNARIVIEVSCLAKPGESVVILTDRNEHRLACARALADAAEEIGAVPVVMDVSACSRRIKGRSGAIDKSNEGALVLKPVQAAVESADIAVRVGGADFPYLLGAQASAQFVHDQFLTAQRRRVHLQSKGMDKWDITSEDVALIRRRTMWLMERLRRVEKVHISSPAGTDFSFGLGGKAKWVPILGIVPLYGEVAITPQQGSESGVVVIDGSTQRGVRPMSEIDREPLRIVVEAGRMKEASGDADQLRRLKEFVHSDNPPGDAIDEVGVVTTPIKANDECWSDGTHRHDTLHVALGNNLKRDTMVHGPLHMDGEVCRPTVRMDGQVIVEGGVFLDTVMGK